jgi:Domain of unknown function (DUF5658)
MKMEFHCPRCGQAFGTNGDLSPGRARCARCGLAHTIPDENVTRPEESSGYQLEPAAVVPRSSPPEKAGPPPSRTRPAHSSRPRWLQYVQPWVFESSHVQGIGACLVVLSAADLLMTFTLLRRSDLFFESNPVAQWFYSQWNITGMVFFKFSMIGGVILLSEIIERKRPGWGRFILLIGCLGAAFAVFQGGRLYLGDSVPVALEMD